MSSSYIGLPIEPTDCQVVDRVLSYPDPQLYSKVSLIELLKIRIKYQGPQPQECFCASVRRRVWLKEFTIWYEEYLRQVGLEAV